MLTPLHLAVVGLPYYRDTNLVHSLVLMSQNMEEIVYPVINKDVLQTPPLIFNFCNRHVIIKYNENESNLLNHIKENILPESKGVIVSLGGNIGGLSFEFSRGIEAKLLKLEDQISVNNLKEIVDLVKASGLPIIYMANTFEISIQSIKQMLDLTENDIFLLYNYFPFGNPFELKQHLLRIFKEIT